MRTSLIFLCFLIFSSMELQRARAQEPVICDPMQAIAVNLEIVIPNPVLEDLRKRGIQQLSLTPAVNFGWRKTFPVQSGARLTLVDNADPLTIDMQEGLLVTYKTCLGDIVYAYCQMTNECLKGEYPKDVRLHLTPALGQCEIEVLCTQCN
ncbi:MAG: hypothetical protein BGO67_02115 [Alphaproteobacteria bacterium 41-28]|nr:MAG: hypothetical protein BGO67_02115 [Alphaproteobacteria bacterium 41-28]